MNSIKFCSSPDVVVLPSLSESLSISAAKDVMNFAAKSKVLSTAASRRKMTMENFRWFTNSSLNSSFDVNCIEFK